MILAALLLFADLYGKKSAENDAEQALAFFDSFLPEPGAGVIAPKSSPAMPTVGFGGRDYAAILNVERFGVRLPVLARWDKKDARRLPCVFAGSAGEGTLVIGGTEDGGLGFLSELDIEDVVTVTDMRGRVYAYVVSNIRHARKADSAALTSTGAPLVLFAKDAGSGDWLLALCTQP